MTRTDNDTWDPASSVGATATLVAVSRALATREPSPLINDSFAEPLARAVGMDFFTRILDGEIGPTDLDGDATFNLARLVTMVSIRTRFYDDFFADAMQTGVRQVVILASGLDTRAYRLGWPKDAVVYEIDQPGVIDFKTRTLAAWEPNRVCSDMRWVSICAMTG